MDREKRVVFEFVESAVLRFRGYAEKNMNVSRFPIELKVNFEEKRSWAMYKRGVYYLDLSFGRHLQALKNRSLIDYPEYKRIESDPMIGAAHSVTWKRAGIYLVAHEFAHLIHYHSIFKLRNFEDTKPHGKKWQSFYRELRASL